MFREKTIVILALFLTLAFTGMAWAQADYAGIYSGTFSGDDSGPWAVHVDANGSVSVNTIGGLVSAQAGPAVLWGSVDAQGDFAATAGTTALGATFLGSIDQAGLTTGAWSNSGSAQTGLFTGQREPADASAYAGVYRGAYTGDDSGSWIATVAANGDITISTVSSQGAGTETFTGRVGGNGTVVAATSLSEMAAIVYCKIDASKAVTGIWGSSYDDVGGNMTGARDGSLPAPSTSSSSTGCFLSSLH